MPKVSSAAKDASKGGFGLQSGRYRVIAARYKIYQPQPNTKTGEQAEPFTCMEFEVNKLNDKWEVTSDEVLSHQFPLAFAQKDENKNMLWLRARPGQGESPDDANPKDVAAEKASIEEMVDIEGNTLCGDDGYKIWDQTPWIQFTTSLESKGWKPDINEQSWAPHYVGLEFACENKELPKPANWKKVQAPTALLVTTINVFPYEKGAKKTAKKETKADAPSSQAANGSGKTNGATSSGADLFGAELTKFIAAHKGQKLSRSQFATELAKQLWKVPEIGMKGAAPLIKAHINTDEGFMMLAMGNGFEVDATSFEAQL